MRIRQVLPVVLLITLSVSSVLPGQTQVSLQIIQQGLSFNRSTSLTIRIVFLGINEDRLNSTYLNSNVSLPALKYQTILAGPINTGVIYNFHYQLIFPDSSLVGKFAQYLNSTGKVETTSAISTLQNPYFSNSSLTFHAMNFFYDADKVESWLAANMTRFGIGPGPG
ncbi:hypothetical protein J2P12_05135, partial [Candidatus Bathyarchaeota archaeon]|nr:hypothetical protein [Candidatus Bathyarchaeota archaeon]